MMNSIDTGWPLVGTTKNKKGRIGSYIKGMTLLVGGVMMGVIVLLAGCPASTSSGNSGSGGTPIAVGEACTASGTACAADLECIANVCAVPIPACDADDDSADCDGDSVSNGDDEFPDNACASRNSDDDMLPDEIIDPDASGSDRCTADEITALIAILVVTVDTCVDRATCTDADDDNDGTLDISDVDIDNDGLIEINFLEDLDFMRHNLAGTTYDDEANDDTGNLGSTSGAPTTEQPACDDGDSNTTLLLCGYELARNLDFAVAASYANNTVSDEWCPGPKTGDTPCVPASPDATTMPGFMPITDADDSAFTAILDGNLFTINNLYIHSTAGNTGLLLDIDGGTIRRLGLTNVSVSNTGDGAVGGLAGSMADAAITAVGVSGAVSSSGTTGGLIGTADGGTISGSWSSVAIEGNTTVGGLVGITTDSVTIYLSYARGSVMASGSNGGGLIGLALATFVHSSWASVTVSGGNNLGGVVGSIISSNLIVSDVYWDSTATTSGVGAGTVSGSPTGLTTDQMQAVGGANFGGSSVADRFGTGCGGAWVFSDATTTHFPKLREIISGADTPADCTDDTYGDELPGQN